MSAEHELLAVAEREHALVTDGRFDELEALHVERAGLLASLPARLAPRQRAVLARAHALQARSSQLASVARDELARELARIDQGRTAVRGYASAGDTPGARVDQHA